MKDFKDEFNQLHYVFKTGKTFLLVAHKSPDPDTIGSTVSLAHYIASCGKKAEIVCFDIFPDYLKNLVNTSFKKPEEVELGKFDAIIGCDSVERGFTKITEKLKPHQVTVMIDHHLETPETADIVLIDPTYSSTCEIIYNFFQSINFPIDNVTATTLLLGILGDTGNLRHANTKPRVLNIAHDLMEKGASPSQISHTTVGDKDITTLHLWGKAIENAKINEKNKMIVTALTKEDMKKANATNEDIKNISSILMTVPEANFSLFLFQTKNGMVKGSMRSEHDRGVNVSTLARKLGGGGHKLASGFEIPGTLVETKEGWKVE